MKLTKIILSAALFASLSFINSSYADSATWSLNPTSGDWNTAADWTPETIPNGSDQIATFADSNQTLVNVSKPTEIGAIVFTPDAISYTIKIAPRKTLTISGTGISNSSQVEQIFTETPGPFGLAGGSLQFMGSASADNATINTSGGDSDSALGGTTIFLDTSTAGSGTFNTTGTSAHAAQAGLISFGGSSTAASGSFLNTGSSYSDFGEGAIMGFGESSSAATATITATAGEVPGAYGGQTQFGGSSDAAAAVLIANGGAGFPGNIGFYQTSSGGTARVELSGDAYLSLDFHDPPGVTIGSLEGDGQVFLGANKLTVGANNLDTAFSGIINGTGSLAKTGKGKLTLSGANTYTGGTTISQGTLRVSNTTGSATGTGAVSVTGGKLGGIGIIAGGTTIGPGNGAVAILEPSAGGKKPATLTIQSALDFKGAVFNYQLDTRRAQGDQVVANGVTIEEAGQFNFAAIANKSLGAGQVFIVISNTSATPISGTFSNLPDGSIFTAGRNSYQANYEGGDGNDLTLTVQ
jgi:autotransporter-associated beta strand protein